MKKPENTPHYASASERARHREAARAFCSEPAIPRSPACDTDTADWPAWLLADYSPSEPWHGEPATDRQLDAIARRGWEPPPGITRGEACHALNKPSSRQYSLLEKYHRWHDGVSFARAKELIDELAKYEGWPRKR